MVVTIETEIPTEEELTVPELKLSGPALRAGAFHLGKYCQDTFNEFMLCRDEEKGDPRKCLKEGREVTNCSFEFFRLIKKSCHAEFAQYAHCLDKSSADLNYKYCRNTQNVFDKCVLDNLNLERPGYGYFCRAQIVDTKRPKPPAPPKHILLVFQMLCLMMHQNHQHNMVAECFRWKFVHVTRQNFTVTHENTIEKQSFIIV